MNKVISVGSTLKTFEAYLGRPLCHGPLLTPPFNEKEQNKYMVPSDRNMLDSFDGFCSLCVLPTAIFKNGFDLHNFSIHF